MFFTTNPDICLMMKKIILVLFIAIGPYLFGQTARVQFIHNSPDVLTEEVDVYFDNQKVLDSMEFRSATPYMNVNANTDIVIAVQSPGLPDTSSSLFRDTLQFKADSTYVVVMAGLISLVPYDSLQPFELDVHKGREQSAASGKVDVMFYHGNTDGPQLTINETTQPISGLVSQLKYSSFTGYIPLDPIDYELDVVNVATQQLLATYLAPFNTLNLADSAIVVMVSGLIDTAQGLPGDSASAIQAPLFGLWAALPGGGPLVELPALSGIGLAEKRIDPIFQIYPIPAGEYLYIDYPAKSPFSGEVEVFDLAGRLILSSSVQIEDSQTVKLDVSSLSRGEYILKWKQKGHIGYTSKILIE